MASPSARREPPYSSQSARSARGRFGLPPVPLAWRRGGAWAIEISLVAASALVPFYLGDYARTRFDDAPVPLNPVLSIAEEKIAKTLAIPVGDRNQTVAPLTNLLWTGALLLPLAVAGVQLYSLAKTGKTPAKRWFNLQVTTATGVPPGIGRVLLREGMGRWGMPLGIAYLIWRYSGAFPGLNILASLSGLLLLGEAGSALLNRQRRGLHDQIAGTYVVDGADLMHPYPFQPYTSDVEDLDGQWDSGWSSDWNDDWHDEDGAIAAIVLAPEASWPRRSLWHWMRQHPGTALVTFAASSLALVLGTVIGVQIYIQGQANWRDAQQQQNQVYLTLVTKLTPNSNNPIAEQQAAILALGTIDDPRAIALLVDLLAQEQNPTLIDAIHQALVSAGPGVLPSLSKLNRSLQTELASLSQGNDPVEQRTAALRQRATQRAIAKILSISSRPFPLIDLSRVDLGQVESGPGQFTLVLEQVDLSGLKFRGTILAFANLRGSQFHTAGADGHMNTFDDQIADLSGAEMKGTNLSGTLLTHVALNRTSLVGANLAKANGAYARLVQANLSTANLAEANFHQAILEQASLTGADLRDANFSQANLQDSRMGQVRATGAQFLHANLSQSDWQGADLHRANLSHANLQRANLNQTQLRAADLRQASLRNASLRNANLEAANLQGTVLDGADLQGASFYPPSPVTPDQFIRITPQPEITGLLQGTDFSHAKNLDADQLTYVCAQGGIHPACP